VTIGRVAGLGAIVLCGGKSRRMGRSKAWLPFGDEALLQRVVRRLSEAAWPVVVVSARDQELPALPEDVRVTHDLAEDRGPLQGIAAGLSALSGHADAAFVSATDAPFVEPALVRHLFALMGQDHDAVVPRAEGHYHPLAAVYRCSVKPEVDRLLAADRRRPFFLFERVRTLVVDEALLGDARALRNLNTPDDYVAALRDAGLAAKGTSG
jgi:molybdenum cofactor guanylyltransferase